ncbi:MAG: NAD-binding protein [Daejeonella sp.]|uniref:NAD-binding protein n=1 Tax=Daejeonella sp. TaxID=2805397 RepID=UPI00273289EA|nr:NAD-binding protein [Daejeonella sp.]MDP3466725.1 NAD-binding protein [Daejeonella sp.]
MGSKSNSKLEKIKLVLIVLSVLLVFVLGILGFKETTGENFNFFAAIYSTICLFLMGNADPVPGSTFLLIAQYLAAILFGLGVFSLVFDQVHNAFVIARIRFTYKDHIVVFSLNEIGHKLVKELLEGGHKVVIVESDKENNFIYQIKELGGLIIIGNGSDGNVINDAALALAKTCIICGDSDQENMEIANEVLFFRQKKETHDSLKILLHITDNNNINILKDYLDIHNQDEEYDLETFNVSQLAARMIYDQYPPHEYLNPEKDDENAIAIIGYNQSAEEFLLENIILSHYPELNNLKIYLIDKDADTYYNEFNYKYPFHSEFIDLNPVKLLNGSFYANFAWSKKDIEKLSKVKVVYMFGNSDSELLSSSANLRQFLYNQTLSISQIPIILCLPEDAGITELLDSNRDPKTNASFVFSKRLNIQLFHLISDTCTTRNLLEQTELIDKLSKIINYYYSIKYEFSYELKDHWKVDNADTLINELEALLHEMPEKDEKITDRTIQKQLIKHLSEKTGIHYNSLYSRLSVEKRWNILTHRKKDSNRYAARQLGLKFSSLKRIGCDPLTIENITRYYAKLAPMEHKRWSAEKMVFNYKYGPLVSDKAERYVLKDVLKIHDQLISYDKLTEVEKEKDLNLFLLLPLLSQIYKSN